MRSYLGFELEERGNKSWGGGGSQGPCSVPIDYRVVLHLGLLHLKPSIRI